jgi:hypothetical protein
MYVYIIGEEIVSDYRNQLEEVAWLKTYLTF